MFMGPKGVSYQVTSPRNTKYTLPHIFYVMCRMSYEHGQKQVPKTMDQLQRLSIPSEMLRFFNHACYPRLGHLTRSVHSNPMNIHYMTYERGPKKVPKTLEYQCTLPPMNIHNIQHMNVAQRKCQRPWKVSALRPPQTCTTCTCQSISNINQHSIFTSFLTLTSSRLNDIINTTTTSFHIHIIIINTINSC